MILFAVLWWVCVGLFGSCRLVLGVTVYVVLVGLCVDIVDMFGPWAWWVWGV